ncbi:MAG: hypothetical protein ACI959_000002 [Limisphaerales bacterium]|jgi:hypothetical protein
MAFLKRPDIEKRKGTGTKINEEKGRKVAVDKYPVNGFEITSPIPFSLLNFLLIFAFLSGQHRCAKVFF